MAKSITSTLVGAAIRDGYIRSMDDKVSDYIPQMKGSAYDDVSIRQLLTMTSGVRWNEDYADPNSDVARFNNHKPEEGVDALVSYLRRLPREVPPGTRWHYSTGETNLVGVLLSQATKKPLATYLSEKIWVPAGMEQQATWILSRTGQEISGCCIQAATRDFARFGLFILNGARVDGQSIVPEGWLAEATTERTGIGQPGRGYGYQWWTYSRRHLRRARHLRPGHLHRPEAQDRDRLQRRLGAAARPTASPARRARRSTARCRRPSTTRPSLSGSARTVPRCSPDSSQPLPERRQATRSGAASCPLGCQPTDRPAPRCRLRTDPNRSCATPAGASGAHGHRVTHSNEAGRATQWCPQPSDCNLHHQRRRAKWHHAFGRPPLRLADELSAIEAAPPGPADTRSRDTEASTASHVTCARHRRSS